MTRRASVYVSMLVVAFATAPVAAQQIAVSKHADPVPTEIADALRPLLADGGGRVAMGDITLDFWWVKGLAAGAAGSNGFEWSAVPEGTLVGAVKVSAQHKDIRGKTINPGVYTLRLAVQPANGDHLGVSAHREFLLVSPAANDGDPKPSGHDGTVDLAKETIGSSHPAAWSLDPPVAAAEPLTTATTAEGFHTVIFEVPVVYAGQASGSVRFGLVVVGIVEA